MKQVEETAEYSSGHCVVREGVRGRERERVAGRGRERRRREWEERERTQRAL